MHRRPAMPALDVVTALAVLSSMLVVVVCVLGIVEEHVRARIARIVATVGRTCAGAGPAGPPTVESTPTARVA